LGSGSKSCLKNVKESLLILFAGEIKVMKFKAIVFDVSDTLVEYRPNYAQIFGERLRYLGFEVSEEKTKEI